MDIKVNEIKNTVPVDSQTTHKASDGQFKFMLVSNIEEKDLQNKLSNLMQQIDAQGEKIANAVINATDHHSTPLVEGISPLPSRATAAFKARATLLKAPSTMWWEFFPAICRMCRLMGQFRVKARKNSSTSSVSKLPIFSVGISKP